MYNLKVKYYTGQYEVVLENMNFETIDQAKQYKQHWIDWNCGPLYNVSNFIIEISDIENNKEII